MKSFLSVLLLTLFTISTSFAQDFADSGTATTTSEGSSHEITMDIDLDQNMKICIDEEALTMNIRFHKSLDSAIENVLSKNLYFSEDDANSLDNMQFSLQSGTLEVTANLKNMTDDAIERLRNLTRELFVILNWEVDMKGL